MHQVSKLLSEVAVPAMSQVVLGFRTFLLLFVKQ
jgi:hypothetical protein